MIPRALYWFIVVMMLAILAVVMWAGHYPARVTVINASGTTLENVIVESGSESNTIPSIANGSASSLKLDSGNPVTLKAQSIRWTSPDRMTPGRSLVLYILPDGKVEARSKIGTMSR